MKIIPTGHVESGQAGQAAVVTGVALAAGDHVLLGRHHVGDGKDIGGVHEVELAGEGNPQGGVACGQRMVPVQGCPVAVGSGEHGPEQGLVDFVVGLAAAVDLEGRNPRIRIVP